MLNSLVQVTWNLLLSVWNTVLDIHIEGGIFSSNSNVITCIVLMKQKEEKGRHSSLPLAGYNLTFCQYSGSNSFLFRGNRSGRENSCRFKGLISVTHMYMHAERLQERLECRSQAEALGHFLP